jgi:hypothetical protein
VFDIMDELEMIGRAVSIKFASCTVINTGDLLAGKTGATRHEVLDAMIAHWMSDPVHGTKTGYSKLASKLVDRVDADTTPKNLVKKTAAKKRAASPEAGSSNSSPHGSSTDFRQPSPLHPDDDRTLVFRHTQDRCKVLVGEHYQFAPPLPLPLVSFPRKKFVA